MFFSFFKRSKTRKDDKNEKQCSNEKQILPDAGAVECVSRKKEKIPKGITSTNVAEKHSKSGVQAQRESNHCANSLVSALHLNLSPSPPNHGAQSVSQQQQQPQYYNNNFRKRNDLCEVGEVNSNNNNSNKGDDDRQKNDNNISKGSSTEITSIDDSYDARTLDGARLSEPISKFSPKLFALRGKRGENKDSTSGNFFNDFIMGKGRQRHRGGARSNPIQNTQPQPKQQKNAKTTPNKQTPQQAHGSGTSDAKKNNGNNGRNLPQNTSTTEKRKNQGDKNEKSTEIVSNIVVRDDVEERDVVKNNTGNVVITETKDSVSECAPDVSDDVTPSRENFPDKETPISASSFIHSLPVNEQGGNSCHSALFVREDSNEFAPPEKKSKTCVNQSDNGENLRENHQKSDSETDEMGQPNSKNGVNNNNESSANFNSSTSEVVAPEEEPKTNLQQQIETMGTDEIIRGGQAQRATSPCGSNITKTVRFNDENLCSYADDIFYEANESAPGSTTSLDHLTEEPLPTYFNNSNCDDVNLNSDKVQKVPLVKCEDDDFDIIPNDDDDDEIPSTYEEAQSISVLVTDNEFFENIVQLPQNNNVQTEINNQKEEENNDENTNSHDSAFNDDENNSNDEENLKIDTTPAKSIYNNPQPPSEKSQENDHEPKTESMTDKNLTENCENIHSFIETPEQNDDTVLHHNNKNLGFMEDTISLPDIVESSHHNGIPAADALKIDEKTDKMGNEM